MHLLCLLVSCSIVIEYRIEQLCCSDTWWYTGCTVLQIPIANWSCSPTFLATFQSFIFNFSSTILDFSCVLCHCLWELSKYLSNAFLNFKVVSKRSWRWVASLLIPTTKQSLCTFSDDSPKLHLYASPHNSNTYVRTSPQFLLAAWILC